MTSNDNRTIMDKQNDVVIEDITLSSQYAPGATEHCKKHNVCEYL